MELQAYYPEHFPRVANPEIFTLRYDRALARLDGVITGEKERFDRQVFEIEKDLLGHEKPNNWNTNVDGNIEQALEVDFQMFAIMVFEGSPQRPEDTSTFSFYARIKVLKERHKKTPKNE